MLPHNWTTETLIRWACIFLVAEGFGRAIGVAIGLIGGALNIYLGRG